MKQSARLMGLIACLGTLLLGSAAHADDALGKKGYGMAGCGLGSMVFGKQRGYIQIIAATLNGTSGTQTFGISSGTSNCADTAGGLASTKAFVEANREALAKDIARGEGETISSLSTLAGCADPSAVGVSLQSDFEQIFPSHTVSDQDVSSSVLHSLKGHPELGCGQIG